MSNAPDVAVPNFLPALLENSLITLTFGISASLNRFNRFIRIAHAGHADIDYNGFLAASLAQVALSDPSQSVVAFFAYNELNLDPADKTVWVPSTLPEPFWSLHAYCALDMTTVNAHLVIPSRLFVPYADTDLRREACLASTCMLPIFFQRVDGGVGIGVTADVDHDRIFNTITRLTGTSLKLMLHLYNYSSYECQIRLRTSSNKTATNISTARLARIVATQVRKCLRSVERENATISCWENERWKFGSGPGYIPIEQVEVLGVVFVSPGKVTPLLQVRPGYTFTV